jgi:hypothetical protein
MMEGLEKTTVSMEMPLATPFPRPHSPLIVHHSLPLRPLLSLPPNLLLLHPLPPLLLFPLPLPPLLLLVFPLPPLLLLPPLSPLPPQLQRWRQNLLSGIRMSWSVSQSILLKVGVVVTPTQTPFTTSSLSHAAPISRAPIVSSALCYISSTWNSFGRTPTTHHLWRYFPVWAMIETSSFNRRPSKNSFLVLIAASERGVGWGERRQRVCHSDSEK